MVKISNLGVDVGMDMVLGVVLTVVVDVVLGMVDEIITEDHQTLKENLTIRSGQKMRIILRGIRWIKGLRTLVIVVE